MDMHIGSKIKEIAKEKRIGAAQLADKMGMVPRNVYIIYKKDDIAVSQLWRLSEVMNYNFFKLFHPVVIDQKNGREEPVEVSRQADQKKFPFALNFEASINQVPDVGNFIRQVHLLAEKMGIVSR